MLLVDPDGRTEPLDLAAGEAWEISGPQGEAWMSLLDEEIRTDLLAVRGSPSAVEALAEHLEAEVLSDGSTTWLSAPDILLNAPWVEDSRAAAITEVSLVRVEESLSAEQPSTPSAGAAAAVPRVPPSRLPADAMPTSEAPTALPEAPAKALRGSTRACADKTPTVARPAAAELVDGWQDHDLAAAGMEAYAGTHLCGDDVLWLHPAGSFAVRGISGTWSVSAPGVIKMERAGQIEFLGSIHPDTGYCRAVWVPLSKN